MTEKKSERVDATSRHRLGGVGRLGWSSFVCLEMSLVISVYSRREDIGVEYVRPRFHRKTS